MKGKNKIQKGFIQIPLLIIVIASTVVASVGAGVILQKQGKLAPLVSNIAQVFWRTEETTLVKEEKTDIEPEPQTDIEPEPQLEEELHTAEEEASQLEMSQEEISQQELEKARLEAEKEKLEAEAEKARLETEKARIEVEKAKTEAEKLREEEEESEIGIEETEPKSQRKEEPEVDPCVNCNSSDKWVNIGPSYSCCVENKQCVCQQQEYYDYSCLEGSCNYVISGFKIIESGCTYCNSNQYCKEGICYRPTEIEEFYNDLVHLNPNGECSTRLKSGILPNDVEYLASIGCYYYKGSVIEKYIQLHLLPYGYYPLDVLIKHNIKPTEEIKTRLELLRSCEFMAQSWNAETRHSIDITPNNVYYNIFKGEGLSVPDPQELDLHPSYRRYCEMDSVLQREYAAKLDVLSSKYNFSISSNIAFLIWGWQSYSFSTPEPQPEQICKKTNTSCGITNCVNCNNSDGCSGGAYLDYYCSDNSCVYNSDDCSDCSCSCGGYNSEESIDNGNCEDGKDNDCDGYVDLKDSKCLSQEEFRVLDGPLGGNITQNSKLTLGNSPYIVTETLQVLEGVKLTIEPGVVIKFDEDTRLNIGGELNAVGTEDNFITFTSNQSNPSPGDWGNIKFVSSAQGSILDTDKNYVGGSAIIYCNIEYAHDNIYAISTPLHVTNNIITNSYKGIYLGDGSIFSYNLLSNISNGYAVSIGSCSSVGCLISHNSITDSHDGIVGYGSYNSIISNNTIKNNTFPTYGAIHIRYGNNNKITNNIVSNNTGNQIINFDSGCTEFSFNSVIDNIPDAGKHVFNVDGNVHLNNNNINNATDYEIYLSSTGDIDTTENWWGTTDTSVIDSKIYDYYDDISLGKVNYQPIATSEISDAGIQ